MVNYQHVKRIIKNPIYLYAIRHYCPKCRSKLVIIKRSEVVSSDSNQAIKYDFSVGDSYMVGNVKFIWDELYCNKCDIYYSVNEMKKLDKLQK